MDAVPTPKGGVARDRLAAVSYRRTDQTQHVTPATLTAMSPAVDNAYHDLGAEL